MENFRYKGKELYCENAKVSQIVKKFGTPLYIYSQSSFVNRFRALKTAFKKIDPLICFSTKACSNIAILRLLVKEGAGLDIVSGGELVRAKKARCPSKKIVFAGVGKSEKEIRDAIQAGIHCFDVESEPELARINKVAKRLRKKKVKVAIRLNPDVESGTHAYITTAKKENKFGIDFKTASQIFKNAKKYKNVSISGIHLHIGSQITQVAPFVRALKKTFKYLKTQSDYVKIDTINFGGGLGIVYDNEKPFNPKAYAKEVEAILSKEGCKLIMEPGRYIAGNSGIFVTKVEYVKRSSAKNFLIVDGAMNDLIRPSLYQAYHNILPVKKKVGKKERYDVVGPVCESGDFFGKGRSLPIQEEGDLVSVMSAGAYGFVMAGNYNTRGMPAEVLVHKNKVSLIRKRQTIQDCLRGEVIPGYIS